MATHMHVDSLGVPPPPPKSDADDSEEEEEKPSPPAGPAEEASAEPSDTAAAGPVDCVAPTQEDSPLPTQAADAADSAAMNTAPEVPHAEPSLAHTPAVPAASAVPPPPATTVTVQSFPQQPTQQPSAQPQPRAPPVGPPQTDVWPSAVRTPATPVMLSAAQQGPPSVAGPADGSVVDPETPPLTRWPIWWITMGINNVPQPRFTPGPGSTSY
eukprot:4500077-Amphidinium_carterae.1